MRHSEVVLDDAMRLGTKVAILRVCAERRWEVWALNPRTNHVHVVVSASATPEAVMNRLKASATSYLRAIGLAADGAKLWSRHGSTVYLWTAEDLASAVEYTLNGQD